MNSQFTTQTRQSILLGELLAQGGEGSVWSVVGRPEVAKIYHPTMVRNDQEAKLSIMVANPPSDAMRSKYHHVSIAWPTALLYQDSKFNGFLMPQLGESFKILEVYNPRLRKARYPGFNWKYLVHTAFNLSIAMNAIHARGYVIGDINESNIMVTRQALVSLIDTDSFQVQDHAGRIFRCPVGREEFTPPELQGVQFNSVNRLPEHDYFGLAVMIFLLLMEGNHPFAGILKKPNPGTDPNNVYCLKQGSFPYANNSLSIPRPTAPPLKLLPPEIQQLMVKCFVEGYATPKARPPTAEWVQALEKTESCLVQCHNDPDHWYSDHLHHCPWCPADSTRLQKPLPPIRAAGTGLNVSAPSSRGAPQAYPTSQPARSPMPTNPPGSTISQVGLKPFGYRSGSTPRSTMKRWGQKAGFSLLGGMLSGVGLSYLFELMFHYPATTSWVLAIVSGVITFSALVLFTRLVYNQLLKPDHPFKNEIGLLLSLLSFLSAFAIGYLMQQLAGSFLVTYQLRFDWLLLESCLLGLGSGAALGTYRFYSRPRQKWQVVFWPALIVLLTLLIVGLVSSQLNPFQPV